MTRTRWIFVGIIVAALAIAGIGIFLTQRGGGSPDAGLTVAKPDAVKVRIADLAAHRALGALGRRRL